MTRPLRIESTGALYHVTSRGNAHLSRNATTRLRDEPSGIMRARKLGDMLAQRKIDEARRLTPEQRLRVALELSDAAAALHYAGSGKTST